MTEDDARKLGRAFAEGFIDSLLGKRESATVTLSPRTASTGDPKWMKLSVFAETRGFARSTVQEWIGAGMPAVPMGRGHRVDVRAAEAWLEAGGAARCRRQDA